LFSDEEVEKEFAPHFEMLSAEFDAIARYRTQKQSEAQEADVDVDELPVVHLEDQDEETMSLDDEDLAFCVFFGW
jgi:hypothetical protein